MMLYPIPCPFAWLLLLVAQSCPTLCNPMDCNMPGFPVLHYLLEKKIVCIDMTLSCPLSRWCYPTISSSVAPISSYPQSFPVSGSFPMSRLFSQVAKVLELQRLSFQGIFSLISFKIDWFDLLAAHGTLKSLLQHHSSKVDVLFSIKQLLVHRCSPCPWLPSARWSFLPLDYLWRFFPHSHQAASLLLASFLSRPSTTYPLLEEWSAVLGPSYLLLITNLLLRQFFSSPLAVFP